MRAVWIVVAAGVLLAGCTPADLLSEDEEEPPQTYYRVQVHLTTERSEAEDVRSRVEAWWDDLDASERPADLDDPAIGVVWQQPYYRVRIGQFASRSRAEDLLPVVRDAFPDALVAREHAETPAAQ